MLGSVLNSVTLQQPQSIQMERIYALYNQLNMYLIFILTFVAWMLMKAILVYSRKQQPQKIVSGKLLEIVWTLIPSILLALIFVPSFKLLYYLNDLKIPERTIKVIGHQWYWSYEYTMLIKQCKIEMMEYNIDCLKTESMREAARKEGIEFLFNDFWLEHEQDSIMVEEEDLNMGFRLLQALPLAMPRQEPLRILITSLDVLHSWAIPSFGIKMDAVPGRLNECSVQLLEDVQIAFGQCSELCGVRHFAMPIVIVTEL